MFWGTPSFFWDKKSTMILFENFKKHPPTPRVLLGLCSIKKVPAPPLVVLLLFKRLIRSLSHKIASYT